MKIVIIQGELILDEAQPVGVLSALARLSQSEHRILVISAATDGHRPYERFQQQLARSGGRVEALLFCAHAASERCRCHAPEYGLLEESTTRFRVDPDRTHVIGEPGLVRAARRLGMGAHELAPGSDPECMQALVAALLDGEAA